MVDVYLAAVEQPFGRDVLEYDLTNEVYNLLATGFCRVEGDREWHLLPRARSVVGLVGAAVDYLREVESANLKGLDIIGHGKNGILSVGSYPPYTTGVNWTYARGAYISPSLPTYAVLVALRQFGWLTSETKVRLLGCHTGRSGVAGHSLIADGPSLLFGLASWLDCSVGAPQGGLTPESFTRFGLAQHERLRWASRCGLDLVVDVCDETRSALPLQHGLAPTMKAIDLAGSRVQLPEADGADTSEILQLRPPTGLRDVLLPRDVEKAALFALFDQSESVPLDRTSYSVDASVWDGDVRIGHLVAEGQYFRVVDDHYPVRPGRLLAVLEMLKSIVPSSGAPLWL